MTAADTTVAVSEDGGWRAVIVESGDAFTFEDFDGNDMAADDVRIEIVRGSAAPNSAGRMPSTYHAADRVVAFEDFEEYEEVETRWRQAQAMAAGLNAAYEVPGKRCPVHDRTDCSPLLNGCHLVAAASPAVTAAGASPAGHLVFDWHAEQKIDPDGWLPWLIPNLLAGMPDVDFEKMSKLTGKFKRCELSIRLNGVEMDARRWLTGTARIVEHEAKVQARKLADEIGFDEIEDAVTDARHAVRTTLRARLAGAGVPMGDDDDE